MTSLVRPRVFLDIQSGADPLGRVVIELYIDKTPKTCENFRALCTGEKGSELHYKSSVFHRIIEEFMIQGGDITRGDGKGGKSIYGGTFEDENLNWCGIDKEGLVCMANRGKDTNSSQFFITCAPCPHLNGKHTVFGHIVNGLSIIKQMETVKTDGTDKPLSQLIVANCGALEFRRAAPTNPSKRDEPKVIEGERRSRSISRSRNRRKGLVSGSPDSKRHKDRSMDRGAVRSEDRKRGRDDRHDRHDSRSKSPRHADDHKSRHVSGSHSPPTRSRSASRSKSPRRVPSPVEHRKSVSRHHRSRRQHSRSRSRSRTRYHSHQHEGRYDSDEERRIRREEEDRESGRSQYRYPPRDDRYIPQVSDSDVKFKGRGSMKFREDKRWGGGYNRFGRLN